MVKALPFFIQYKNLPFTWKAGIGVLNVNT
jgi:hypothetical protein